MADNSLNSQIGTARKAGYSDDEILDYLGQSKPDMGGKIKLARDSGYSAAQIMAHLSGEQSGAAPVPGMERLGGTPPPAPTPPTPEGLSNIDQDTGMRAPRFPHAQTVDSSTLPPAPYDFEAKGAQKVAEGVAQAGQPGLRAKAGGVSKVLRGAGQMAAPMMIPAAVTAPLATTAGLATGSIAGAGTEAGLKAVGVPEEYSELAGDVAGVGAGVAAAKAAPGVKEAITNKFSRDPKVSMVKAIKPISTNVTFKQSLDRSLPELKASELESGKPIENLGDLIDSIEVAKKRVWSQYQDMATQKSIDPYSGKPTVGSAADAQYDMSSVADAMEATISAKLRRENPVAAKAIMKLASKYRTAMSLQEAESILKTGNAELEGYYAKYPPSQRKALAANPQVAMKEAQVSALRDAIYNALDSSGEGAVPREVKQRYGALMNLEREAYRRQNVAERQQPDSLSEQVGKWSAFGHAIKGTARLATGDVGGAADIAGAIAQRKAATWLKEQQTTDALIRSALANYKGTPTPLGTPAPFKPKALIGSGDIVTPAPADTSYVRSAPAMRQVGNRRALPPPSDIITPAPEDTSYVRSVPAVPAVGNRPLALPPPGIPEPDYLDQDLGSRYGDVLGPRLLRRPPMLRPPQ